jgi:hypothetical protein
VTVYVGPDKTETTADDGTDQISTVGTDSGTFVQAITADVESKAITNELGTVSTHVNGTITGDDHVDGTPTDNGTETHELEATGTTNVLGTDTITAVGTLDGTSSHEMITVYVLTTITLDVGNE